MPLEYKVTKILTHGAEARRELLAGVQAVAKMVSATLGPKGRNIIIERFFEDAGSKTVFPIGVHVTKDGVTVARSVSLLNRIQDLGVQLVREASEQSVRQCGDGTTTAMVLAAAIFELGLQAVEAGANPVWVKRGIDKAVEQIVATLETMAVPVSGDMAHQVACVSANGQTEIADLVIEAFDKATKDGVVMPGDSKTVTSWVDATKGMRVDSGYLVENFVTDPQKNECVLDNPLILLHEQRVVTLASILPLADFAAKNNRPLLILSENVENEALQALVVNREKLRSCAVKLPFYGDMRKALLEDLAAVLGGKAITENLGMKMENITPDLLGTCERVVITRTTTTFVGGGAKKEATDLRIAQVRGALAKSEVDYEKDQLANRLAKLAGGIAVIRVGAATPAEMKEKKDRVEDAIGAVKAAYDGGVLPGGGVALLIASHAGTTNGWSAEEIQGAQIVYDACGKPFETILVNGGYNVKDNGVYADGKGAYLSLNAMTGEREDLIKSGVIDPFKVVKSALINAASVAGTMLTAEGVISLTPPEGKK